MSETEIFFILLVKYVKYLTSMSAFYWPLLAKYIQNILFFLYIGHKEILITSRVRCFIIESSADTIKLPPVNIQSFL